MNVGSVNDYYTTKKKTQQFGDGVGYVVGYVGQGAITTVDDRVSAGAVRWADSGRGTVLMDLTCLGRYVWQKHRLYSTSRHHRRHHLNPLTATLKPHSNGHHIAIQWLVHWPLMGELLHSVQRGGDWAGLRPAQAAPRSTKCNSPPINGQCANFVSFDVAL